MRNRWARPAAAILLVAAACSADDSPSDAQPPTESGGICAIGVVGSRSPTGDAESTPGLLERAFEGGSGLVDATLTLRERLASPSSDDVHLIVFELEVHAVLAPPPGAAPSVGERVETVEVVPADWCPSDLDDGAARRFVTLAERVVTRPPGVPWRTFAIFRDEADGSATFDSYRALAPTEIAEVLDDRRDDDPADLPMSELLRRRIAGRSG
ncbi:MAG: hypothetical protein R8F63_05420 [Acidimicrobiales bacterium]|nr:hypothetical protein [Acidimicrobiales bacterium]